MWGGGGEKMGAFGLGYIVLYSGALTFDGRSTTRDGKQCQHFCDSVRSLGEMSLSTYSHSNDSYKHFL